MIMRCPSWADVANVANNLATAANGAVKNTVDTYRRNSWFGFPCRNPKLLKQEALDELRGSIESINAHIQDRLGVIAGELVRLRGLEGAAQADPRRLREIGSQINSAEQLQGTFQDILQSNNELNRLANAYTQLLLDPNTTDANITAFNRDFQARRGALMEQLENHISGLWNAHAGMNNDDHNEQQTQRNLYLNDLILYARHVAKAADLVSYNQTSNTIENFLKKGLCSTATASQTSIRKDEICSATVTFVTGSSGMSHFKSGGSKTVEQDLHISLEQMRAAITALNREINEHPRRNGTITMTISGNNNDENILDAHLEFPSEQERTTFLTRLKEISDENLAAPPARLGMGGP
jgi:hypothetical protein